MAHNGAQSLADAAATTDEQIRVAQDGLVLMGFSAKETAGATAALTIRNGTGTGDPAVAHCSLAANEAKVVWFSELGIKCPNGIYLDRTSGTTEVAVYSYP